MPPAGRSLDASPTARAAQTTAARPHRASSSPVATVGPVRLVVQTGDATPSATSIPTGGRPGPRPASRSGPTIVTAPAQLVRHDEPVVPPLDSTGITIPTTTTTTTSEAPTLVDGVHTAGIVTYYDHEPGTCASPWLPFGTVVEVTNPANDESVTCVVDDREADTARSIDLATSTFAEIAPLWQGVIDARLSW